MPVSRSRPGWMTTIGSDRTHPWATQHRRRSPPNWISNGLLSYALRAPLRSPLLQPRLCAKQPPGSSASWRKTGGHVTDSLPRSCPSNPRAPWLLLEKAALNQCTTVLGIPTQLLSTGHRYEPALPSLPRSPMRYSSSDNAAPRLRGQHRFQGTCAIR